MSILLSIFFVCAGLCTGWYLRGKAPRANWQPHLDEKLSNLGHLYLNAANAAKNNPHTRHGEERRLREASNAFFAAAAASRESREVKEIKFL